MWIQPLLLTLQLMAVSVTVAAVIGIVGAWAACSLNRGGRLERTIAYFFFVSMVVAIALPMILHAAAWESSAGKFGWMIMTQTGSRAAGTGAYGFFGGLLACGWIHGLLGSAIVALATWHGVSQVPSSVIEQSLLERGPVAAWWKVQLPIAAPWVSTALLATALLAATEMTVVDLYGYRTIADEFYLFYAVNPSVASVVATCCVPLAITLTILVLLFGMRQRILSRRSFSDDTSVDSEPLSSRWRWLAGLLAVAIASLVVLVPIAGLIVKVGHEVSVQEGSVIASWSLSASLDRLFSAPTIFSHEYAWTAALAAMAGIAAVAVAWPLAAMGRTHRSLERPIDVISIVMITVPGPIVGLLVVSLFQRPIPGFAVLYQQTLLPTLLAVLVRAAPVAYWVLRAGYRSLGDDVIEAGRLDGSWVWRIWSVDRPLLKRSLVTAFLAAGVMASGDVPAALPVIPPGVTTVGTRLFGLLHSGARYQEAALAIWYVAAVVVIALVLVRQYRASRVRV